ncbi:MAG: holo-ACP synthase [Simkaniaceae bacterium]|nr:holo-ACP synthase [Simkaniaceae bacterium]
MHGIGTDIIEIKRMRKAIKKHKEHFLDRLFSEKEQQDCENYKDPALRFSGRFAAKEAIAKALGVGFGKKLKWLDMEIQNLETGQPVVKFSNDVEKRFNHPKIHISISHCKSYATAVAIWD